MATPADPRLLLTLVTDDSLPAARTVEIVEAACDAAPVTVQLRARGWSGRDLCHAAERLREVTRSAGCRLAVHDRLDIAMAVEADAVHLPSTGIAAPKARRLLDRHRGPPLELGVSVHSDAEISALSRVADYVHFGPVFETASKVRFGVPQGVGALGRAVAVARSLDSYLRVIAVGGLAAQNVASACDAGADGVAVLGAVMHAEDPAAAVREILAALRRERA